MTEEEALSKIKKDLDKAEAINNGLVTTTIGALKRVYQMAEKQRPEKPKDVSKWAPQFSCECGRNVEKEFHRYCPHCGQRLDWGQE